MTKILSGFLGLVLVASVVAGTAYALFSSSATVSGITVTAGSAALLVKNGEDFTDSWNTGLNLNNVYPGYNNSTTITLKNNSTTPISLGITGQLTAATNWPNLADAVEIAVNNGGSSTGWKTLAQWNAAPVAFPGPAIPSGTAQDYTVYVRVPTVYDSGALAGSPVGNEIAGQILSNITFTLTGTQE